MALTDSHIQDLLQRFYIHDLIQSARIWLLEYSPRHINWYNYTKATKDSQSVPLPM